MSVAEWKRTRSAVVFNSLDRSILRTALWTSLSKPERAESRQQTTAIPKGRGLSSRDSPRAIMLNVKEDRKRTERRGLFWKTIHQSIRAAISCLELLPPLIFLDAFVISNPT